MVMGGTASQDGNLAQLSKVSKEKPPKKETVCLFGEKWRSFFNSLPSMLELRSTVHTVAWQFNNLAYSSGLMFGRVISYNCFQVTI